MSSTRPERLEFPKGFLWGVGLSAQQAEGNSPANNWSRWEAEGRIMDGQRFGRAANWWENAELDMDLARQLGVNALRFSIDWGRIEPERDEWDASAIQRYRQIVKGLCARGIEPMVCLHHFTNPVWFEKDGGFLARDAAERFERYARRMAEALSDDVRFWLTFNEPNVYSAMGYLFGEFPPGLKGRALKFIRVNASMARAHARAYRAIHQVRPDAQVSWAQHHFIIDPARPGSWLDRTLTRLQDRLFNDGFTDLLTTGRGWPGTHLLMGDLGEVKDTFDFLGINQYGHVLIRFDPRPWLIFHRRLTPPGAITGSDNGELYGEVYPDGISRMANRLRKYGKPLYVLENGVADNTDRVRPWLISAAVKNVHDLLQDDHDIRGYFHWTLTDNFEWNWGFKLRFGLIELDPVTQKRTIRRSGRLFSAIAHANAVTPEMLEEFVPGKPATGFQK